MARTSPFSIRLTKEIREMIEEKAELLRLKPSVLAAMILKDCTETWVKEYVKEIYSLLGDDKK